MKGNKLIAAVTAALLFGTAMSAHAGQQSGKVLRITTRASDGLILVVLDGGLSGRPGCATRDYWLIKSESSDAGKRQFAHLLAAQAANRTVTVFGANTCTRWGDGEDIESVEG